MLFQFEIIINVLVSSFRFISIPTARINILLFQCGNRLRRKNLTSIDVRSCRQIFPIEI